MWLLDFLFPLRLDERAIREVSLDAFLALVNPQLVPETRPATVALLPFSLGRVRSAIHEAKYHGSEYAFQLLGAALAEYLRDSDELGKKPVIVPVPLGKERRKERGFNQVEEIVKRAAKQLGSMVDATFLERTRDTPTQVDLPRHKRKENMRGAFKATRRAESSHTYILVDDVLTTGATLQAAIDALQEAGAENIIPIALAH